MLEIVSYVLGMVETNTYLLADPASGEAAVIDPAWNGEWIVAQAEIHGWRIAHIWLTHAHFDHMAGASGLTKAINPPPPVALHPVDLDLYRMQGGAPIFGLRIEPGPTPQIELAHGQQLRVGSIDLEVRHTPGHTPGHVVFYCSSEGVLFCGDVIFQGSIGRTDLPGGDYRTLIHSIRRQILTLPEETRLLSGHGPESSVSVERIKNPFLDGM
jgi:hydroxyacylglutathione hydrolase